MPYRKDLHYNSSRKPWWWLNIHLDGFVEFESLMGRPPPLRMVWWSKSSSSLYTSWVFCLFRFALLAIHSWSSFGYCYICLIDLMLILILFCCCWLAEILFALSWLVTANTFAPQTLFESQLPARLGCRGLEYLTCHLTVNLRIQQKNQHLSISTSAFTLAWPRSDRASNCYSKSLCTSCLGWVLLSWRTDWLTD